MENFIAWFENLDLADVALVGGKNASLGEMIKELASQGVKVPSGFVVTADAYSELVRSSGIGSQLTELLRNVDKNNIDQLSICGQTARAMIKQAGLPEAVAAEISQAYRQMETRYGAGVDVAVRSSATAEDLPEASFAGQQETFLNVRGQGALLESCLNCFASLFTDRAIAYRIDKGFDHMSVRLSIGVQKMIRSDLAVSGVIFTLDPESGFRNTVLVTSAYGLGENIVAGRVDPDEFLIFKPTLETSPLPVLKRKCGSKQYRMIYAGHGTRTTRNVDVSLEDQRRLSLSDEEALLLARWACIIEQHYSQAYGRPAPMDIEWAKDGKDGQLYIVQARPETVHSCQDNRSLLTYQLKGKGSPLLTGRAIGERIGAGKARIIGSPHELDRFCDGEILVADMTDPDWEPIMKRASGIITNRGGRTCHAAIVSRELGVPCIVGTGNGTELLPIGKDVTVSCAEGATGVVYEGILPWEMKQIHLDQLPRTKTQIYVNLGNPEHAFKLSSLPVDGVGLAREEFIIVNDVKVHPLALTRFDSLTDENVRFQIDELTRGYADKESYFVEKLSEGVGMLAAAFFPRPVIVRLSDFKTNEYANLLGGAQFEPKEENPMIGFRGASRYYDERFRDGFKLECRALRRVREEMGLTNVKVMVPFCRTAEEGRRVIDEMALNGLIQGDNGLEVYVMCELPANVWAIDLFGAIFDGFSIGSNDLTQLVLGLDRDSEIVSRLFDERNPAVKRALALAIDGAHQAGRKIGICGQAPSDYPEMVRFLLEHNIDSISLNEDVVLKTLLMVAEEERALALRETAGRALT